MLAAIKSAANSPIAVDILNKINELYAQATLNVTELEQHAMARIHGATEPAKKSVIADEAKTAKADEVKTAKAVKA